MNDLLLLGHLEELAIRLGIELRYENLGQTGFRSMGGLCKVAGKPLILLNSRDPRRQKIRVLAESLKKLDMEGIFIPPAVRRVLERENN